MKDAPEQIKSALGSIVGKLSGKGEGHGRQMVSEVWAEVHANNARLDACTGPHKFTCLEPEKRIGAKHRCELCGGILSSGHVRWYQLGLEHARK